CAKPSGVGWLNGTFIVLISTSDIPRKGSDLVQGLGEQRQRDHHSDGKEGNPCRLRQSPKRVSDDGHNEARIRVRLFDRAGGEQNWLSTPGEKRVRGARGRGLGGPP